jgi:hypothetical protein
MGLRFLALIGALALAGCSASNDGKPFWSPKSAVPAHHTPYAIAHLTVTVPPQLVVSEAHMLYPMADIVWRGDKPGNRYAQVRALFEEAAREGNITKGRRADVAIEVMRFHALTEMARYYTGGIYGVHFRLTITDPKTHELLEKPRVVKADLPQWGSNLAPEYDAQGITERMVAIKWIRETLQHQLGQD